MFLFKFGNHLLQDFYSSQQGVDNLRLLRHWELSGS